MPPVTNTAFAYEVLFNILGWTGVSSTLISFEGEKVSRYKLRKSYFPCLVLHVIYRVNYIAKLVYLIFLLLGAFPNIGFEFLDYITVGFWFLVLGLIFIGEGFWFRTYPFFEIITAGWEIQNEIHSRLRRPDMFLGQLQYSVMKKAIFQIVIMAVGTIAMGIQYSAAPKYPIFTGYLVEEDSTLMTVLFGFHDIGFLLTAWIFYGPVICLSSLLGRQISMTVEFMTDELRQLINELDKPSSKHKHKRMEFENQFEFQLNRLDSASLRQYSIDSLITDYKKLVMYMDRLNEFASYKFLFIHITAYIQMIGDVFIMIQMLRSGGEFMDVFFYLEDCGVCMYMLFKCFKAMSLVQPAAEDFLHTYRTYLTNSVPSRTYYIKTLKAIRPIALKIGPNFVGPETVGNAMMVLLNYYIAAALW